MSDVLENLLKQDTEYSESKFKSKVENTFVQIKLSMVTGRTEKIRHFVNDETYGKIIQKVNTDIQNNRIQMYDELNVADIQIVNIRELEDYFEINVRVHSKALEYYINRETKKFINGDTNDRTERYVNMTYRKRKDAKIFKVSRKCPNCGANIDVNASGFCVYCRSTFDLEKYDWIITYMDI